MSFLYIDKYTPQTICDVLQASIPSSFIQLEGFIFNYFRRSSFWYYIMQFQKICLQVGMFCVLNHSIIDNKRHQQKQYSLRKKKGNSTLGRVNQKTVASGLYFIIPATENNWQCYPDRLLFCVVNIIIFLARDLLIISSVDGKQWSSCQHHLSSLLIRWYRYAQPLLQNIFSLECFLRKLDTLDYNTH